MKFTGTVITGAKMAGKVFGLPTANLKIETDLEPGGAYAGKATVGDKTFDALIYYGMENHILEAHLFNFTGNLVGQELTVEPLEKVSDFVPFKSIEQMKKKIESDVSRARELLLKAPDPERMRRA